MPALGPVLETIAVRLRSVSATTSESWKRSAKSITQKTKLLRQVEGVGSLTALTRSCSPSKTPTASKRAAAWALIWDSCPPETSRERGIPRNASLEGRFGDAKRRLLVSCAHYILVPFGSDPDLRRHGQKIASRGAKNSKKRAAVAVDRKLGVLLHSLWISGELYEPLRNTDRSSGGQAT
jgi:hypothetical protein